MKLQLILPQHYQNATQFEDCQMFNIEQIDNVPDATCTFIYLSNCCDFVPNRQEILAKAIKKLRYGGQILIEGTDLIEVSYGIARDFIQPNDVQSLLFHGRYSCSTINDMKEQLQSLQLKIINNRLMQYKYSIRAERPKPNVR